MLRSPDDVEPGQQVHLYPHSMIAGRWCWMQKEAVIVDAKRFWPLVHVQVQHGGKTIDTYPSRDNIRLRPKQAAKADKQGGDGPAERSVPSSFRKRAVARPAAQVKDQMELF